MSNFRDGTPQTPRSPSPRTYSHADWLLAQDAWTEGEFSDEWKLWRHRAAMDCGIIFPPSGDRYDSWEDDAPSQRAILIRAIRETPKLLASCYRGSRSWSDIIGKLIGKRDQWRDDLREEDEPDGPSHAEASMTIKQIMDRIGAS